MLGAGLVDELVAVKPDATGDAVVADGHDGDSPDADRPSIPQVVQRKQQDHRRKVLRAASTQLSDEVDAIAFEVRRSRWMRLNKWAVKKRWSPDVPPPEAALDRQIELWWLEWVQLGRELSRDSIYGD